MTATVERATTPAKPRLRSRHGNATSKAIGQRWWTRAIVHLVVFIFMIVWFTPVLGLFVTSVRTPADTAATGWWHAVIEPLFTGYNYQQAISVIGVGPSMATSIALSLPITVMTTLLSAIGAFALARMSFRGRTLVSVVLVALLVIPPQVTLVPLLRAFNVTHLNGTMPAVWIYEVGFTVPFGIFLLRGYIGAIPGELFESASIDGAGMLRTFRSIVLPLSAPALASLAIMQFLWAWNDLLTPLLFLGGTAMPQPITVNVAGLVQAQGQGQSQLVAATFLSILLPLIVLATMQRYFVRGVLGGAVKG